VSRQVSPSAPVFRLHGNGLDARAVEQADEVLKMKSALSFMLIVCLVASALPAAAQEQTATPEAFDLRGSTSQAAARPLARAVAREAVRLAAAGGSIPPGGDTVQQDDKPAAKSSWLRVRTIAPGSEIVLTVKGAPPDRRYVDRRYVVLVDESELTFLNLTDPALPHAARDVLRDVVSDHPDYFPAAQQGKTFRLEENVYLGPDGVFVRGLKIAELDQVLEQIARSSVSEISVVARATRRGVKWGSLIGTGAGLTIGLLIQIPYCRQHSCDSQGGLITPLITMWSAGIGTGLGALIGAGYQTRDVLYRAP
jgi:hypothetical protein